MEKVILVWGAAEVLRWCANKTCKNRRRSLLLTTTNGASGAAKALGRALDAVRDAADRIGVSWSPGVVMFETPCLNGWLNRLGEHPWYKNDEEDEDGYDGGGASHGRFETLASLSHPSVPVGPDIITRHVLSGGGGGVSSMVVMPFRSLDDSMFPNDHEGGHANDASDHLEIRIQFFVQVIFEL